jgi:large conductance mechanosensitive channel
MKNMLKEFKEFIASGDLVTTAIGLVMALYTKAVIDKFMEGVVNPIIAAIFGKTDLSSIGFDLGDSFVSIGLVISAVIDLVIVGFVLFLVLKAYNNYKKQQPAAPAGPTEVELLTEIRDSLRNRG